MRDRGAQSSPRAPSSIVLISCRPVVDLRQVAFANNLMQLALRLSSHFVTPFGEGMAGIGRSNSLHRGNDATALQIAAHTPCRLVLVQKPKLWQTRNGRTRDVPPPSIRSRRKATPSRRLTGSGFRPNY
jgi:hypothetical protein